MTTNIIQLSQFRKPQELPEPKSPELTELERLEYIDNIIDDLVPDIVTSLIECGFNVTGDKHVKDVALMVEAVRAAMFSVDGRYHGLHAISNKINVESVPIPIGHSANTAIDA